MGLDRTDYNRGYEDGRKDMRRNIREVTKQMRVFSSAKLVMTLKDWARKVEDAAMVNRG